MKKGAYPFTKPKEEMLPIFKAHPTYESGFLSDSHEGFFKVLKYKQLM
ncbi:hypothetical protein [Paenimyroides aestuarii]|uniref:Uncharacterized protein n=1 Tax=Paenimyroides aestuarii TaxID=2968490 RepID=A0ABY5NUW1_9FLAO|nr:hypothetical protein [Paenimyroides aestuarii]UUV22372.1 hypothetical protein NPX36_04855 [Paenimyroides aestuarii]